MGAVHDGMKDTDIVWTCNNERLPMIMERRTDGSSRSPMFAAVPSRADRFMSRVPCRFRTTGMIMMNWSTSRIAEALLVFFLYLRDAMCAPRPGPTVFL